jgi:hypothetical protein
MQNIKKTALYSIVIIASLMSHFSYAGGDAAFVKATKELGVVVATNMPELIKASTGFGANIGTGALTLLGNGITNTAVAVKTTTAAIIAAPATPYVVGGGLACAGAYKVYRAYNPTPEDIAKTEEYKKQAEQYRSEAENYKALGEHHKAHGMDGRRKQEIFKTEESLRQCLVKNRGGHGVPPACADLAVAFAVIAGHAPVDEMVTSFNKYSRVY